MKKKKDNKISHKRINKTYKEYRELIRNRLSYLGKNESGVSNIVTSIMMLGIFLSILAMIFTIYIPEWAKTGEANHMDDVEKSFLNLKSTIDEQIIDDDGVGSKRSTEIKLGAEGGAIMGIGRTSGSLDMKTSEFSFFIYNTNDTSDIYGKSNGRISFRSQNMYYTNQYFYYENGAIIVKQGENAVMRAEPDLEIYYNNNKTTLTLTQIHLLGGSDNVGGTDFHTIDSTLVQSVGKYNKLEWTANKGFPYGQNLTINITTEFGEVWENFLNAKLDNLPDTIRNNIAQLTSIQYRDVVTNTDMYKITLTLKNVNIFDCKKGIVEIELN